PKASAILQEAVGGGEKTSFGSLPFSKPKSRMGAGVPQAPSLIGSSWPNKACSPESRRTQSMRPASTSAAVQRSGGGGGPMGSGAAPAGFSIGSFAASFEACPAGG